MNIFKCGNSKTKYYDVSKKVYNVSKKKQAVLCGLVTNFQFFFSMTQCGAGDFASECLLTNSDSTTQDPVWSWTSNVTARASVSTTAEQGGKGPWGLRNSPRSRVGTWQALSKQPLLSYKGRLGPVQRGQSAPLRALNLSEQSTECHWRPWSREITKCSRASRKSV